MRTAASDLAAARRAELAAFLRARRADLRPEEAGIDAAPGRRNTPGLRREEVAVAAGVSVGWYTWLEQGRRADPSSEVIDAIARVLLLDAESHRHLRRLAGLVDPDPTPQSQSLGPQLTRLLDILEPAPACLIDEHFDFAAWNAPFAGIWKPDTLPPGRCNLMWLYFARGTPASMGVGWEERGRHLLGQFREAAAEHPLDARFAELVSALKEESEQFATWWADNRVERALTGQITIRRPPVGIIRLDVTELVVAADPSLTLCVQVPHRPADREKLSQLVRLD
ncbi:MAG: helix-turn-helix transcriptional regulator [Actinomycetota bacterium]|nr:helix-turn-helix transcriptional regulator [Actinomycetota bacterium]MDA8072865.1 helix-turn-helix transcriptional regulator [Actinomycetota bacterium]